MMMWSSYMLQDMTHNYILSWFMDFNFLLLVFIMSLISVLFLSIMFSVMVSMISYENTFLEFFWTISPGIILMFLGLPSLKLLYSMEMKWSFLMSIKTSAHQWYWSYVYSGFPSLEFDSFMKPMDALINGEPHLLESDNHLILPSVGEVMMVISSDDVLHSWSMPSMGVKMDANPGRLNTLSLGSVSSGMYYGQCSEICGANHSFMPISLEITTPFLFKMWSMNF